MSNAEIKKRIACATMAALAAVVLVIRILIIPSNDAVWYGGEEASADAAEGYEVIKSLAARDTAEVEQELQEYRNQQMIEYYNSGNFRELYKDVMIMGDSHAEGFYSFGLLPDSMVAATIGKSFFNCENDRAKVMAAKPKTLIVNYGQNSVSWHNGNTTDMTESYREFLKGLRNDLPDTRLIVCSVLVSQPEAVKSEPYSGIIPELNQKISEMCAEEGIEFIDITPIIEDRYYEPDHIHTDAKFHKIWLGYMAAEAGFF